MLEKFSILLFTLAGCTVMVNGKPRRIGGGPDPAPAAAQPTTTATAPAATPAVAKPAAPPLPPGKALVVDGSIGRDPTVVSMTAVFDTTWSKVFGFNSRSPDCGLDITSRPIGAFEITKQDTELHVAVVGHRNDGFVVRKGDLYWTSCDSTMEPPQESWQPGRYDVYPVARYGEKGKAIPYELELYRPNAPVTNDKAQKLVISGKLDKPMFVEVALPATRRKLRERHSGDNCEKVALSATPDIALTIERPIPGLTIRPLPSATPITMRREKAGSDKRRAEKYCVETRERHHKRGQPSYVAASELHFGNDDEGEYGVSLGTPNAEETKVTLMIFDATTKFDEMTVRPFGGENPTLEQRWIGYHLPQLDASELGNSDNYEEAEREARVFAAVPKHALVYAKLNFDKDLGGADGFPVKNEPMVLLGLERERATVMTADGFKFYVKASHLVLAPDGPVALPAAPRPMTKLEIGGTIALLSPAQKKLGDAHYGKVKAREACLDRAWEPYRRQLPSYTRPAGVDIVVYKSPRTKAIEEAGERAMDKKCGTSQAFSKQTEATRVKLAVEVEKTRAKLLAQATANLK